MDEYDDQLHPVELYKNHNICIAKLRKAGMDLKGSSTRLKFASADYKQDVDEKPGYIQLHEQWMDFRRRI